MSDHLDISGGATGVAAALDDVRLHAALLAAASRELLGTGQHVAAVGAAADLAQAALLCPELVVAAERALAQACAGPAEGLFVVGAELAWLAEAVRWCAEAYERADAGIAAGLTATTQVGGFVLGLAAPVVVGGAVVTAAGNPVIMALLARYLTAGGTPETLLGQHPELLDLTLRLLPWAVQGSAVGLCGLGGVGGQVGLRVLTDGQWPTGSFENAVGGLAGVGRHAGALTDTGRFRVAPFPEAVSPAARLDPSRPLTELLRQQEWMDSWIPAPTQAQREVIADRAGQLSIVTVLAPDGSMSYVVHIPGTEVWTPRRGDNPLDLSTNVALMAAHQAEVTALVAAAIRAHVPAGSPVLLVGHSQGGLTAASVASDRTLTTAFDVRGVVTVGSPVARFPIDPRVSVLSVEHTEDVVPLLDGAANPDRPTWVTVRRDLTDPGLSPNAAGASLATSHDLATYRATALDVDACDDPALVAWREANAVFFTGVARSAQYAIVPEVNSPP